MSAYQGIANNKFRELLSLMNLYLEEEIEERIYEAYEDKEISPTQYDYLVGMIEQLSC